MAQVRRLVSRVSSRLALFCIHRMNHWVNSRSDSESWWQHHKHCPGYYFYYYYYYYWYPLWSQSVQFVSDFRYHYSLWQKWPCPSSTRMSLVQSARSMIWPKGVLGWWHVLILLSITVQFIPITGWDVAQTYCIRQCTKYRKSGKFDYPWEQNPWNSEKSFYTYEHYSLAYTLMSG